MNLVPTDDPKFVKDKDSSAIINIDKVGWEQYKHARRNILQQEQLAKDVVSLQNEIGDIKNLLQQLLDGKIK